MITVNDCRLIDLPRIQDPRGNLSYVETERHLPFEFRRVFYLYDVPGGEQRAGHALKTCHQFLIAMSGSFDVVVKDGYTERRVHLNRSYNGLHLPPRVWRELDNFSSGSVCMVIASRPYDESDYYRDYREFLAAVAAGD
ncbi:MAG TPA: FdtA/QdtA family cupin domain-containing protein [Burkholderiaceae bacterium]|nr:FdtA/QdtA family cupin domain-containing protein [Burkholderiaceae bacterium]